MYKNIFPKNKRCITYLCCKIILDILVTTNKHIIANEDLWMEAYHLLEVYHLPAKKSLEQWLPPIAPVSLGISAKNKFGNNISSIKLQNLRNNFIGIGKCSPNFNGQGTTGVDLLLSPFNKTFHVMVL